MLNYQKVGINNMNVRIKNLCKISYYDIVVITFHEDDLYCDHLSPALLDTI